MKKLILSALALSLMAAPAMAGQSGPSVGGVKAIVGTPVIAFDTDKASLAVAGGGNSFDIRGDNSINLTTSNNGNALTAQIINDSPFHLEPLNAGVKGDLNNNPFNVSTIMAYSHFEKPQFNFNKLQGNDTTTTPDLSGINFNVYATAEANAGVNTGLSERFASPIVPISSASASARVGAGTIDPKLQN